MTLRRQISVRASLAPRGMKKKRSWRSKPLYGTMLCQWGCQTQNSPKV